MKVYFQWKLIAVLFLGISSGLPLALTMGTLTFWLSKNGINKATIGAVALIGLPYTFKFLWAPVMDHLSIPVLTRYLGKRRGWLLLTQVLLAFSIYQMGRVDPKLDVTALCLMAVVVAFFSASQDVVIDAFRIEILDEKSYGAGAGMIVLGYRLGLMISSAGALVLATYLTWETVYSIMAFCVGIGIITTCLCSEPPTSKAVTNDATSLLERIKSMTLAPTLDFITRPQWLIILFFIVFYKLGDAFLGIMLNPFYLEAGFTEIEIASVTKLFGIVATIAGGLVGGILVFRAGILRALLICGLLQILSNLVFALLALAGHSITMLTITIGLENFASGMGGAAFVAYLSSLCSIGFTGTQYAVLSSLSSVGRTVFSATAGMVAARTSWINFFIISSIIAVPAILALLWLMRPTLQHKTNFEPARTT